jgi:hypothetical protein
MAYPLDHNADVFISYAHSDNFAWIEGFKRELEKALIWKLRATNKPEIFVDTESLRAGRIFDKEIAECLEDRVKARQEQLESGKSGMELM